jgi:hypothetical protein
MDRTATPISPAPARVAQRGRLRPVNMQTGDACGIAATISLPPAALDALVDRIVTAVAAAVESQARPCRLLDDARVCAELLGCSTQTLRVRLLPLGIPYLLIGDQRRWDADQVIAWLRSRQLQARE